MDRAGPSRYAPAPWRAWYKTAQWRAIRKHQQQTQPLCARCHAEGRVTPMDVCDHVHPHRGDKVRFFDGPFQSLCHACHNGAKQREEQASVATRGIWD